MTYWHVGRRIVEQEQNGNDRAEYGKRLISVLAEELSKEYGKSYSKRNLQYFRKFYLYFPDEQIVNACVHNLSWTHFRSLLRVPDEEARFWYMKEAVDEGSNDKKRFSICSIRHYRRMEACRMSKSGELLREFCQGNV